MDKKRPAIAPVACIVVLCLFMALVSFAAQRKGGQASEVPRKEVTVLEVVRVQKDRAMGLDQSSDYFVFFGDPERPMRREITYEMAQELGPGDTVEVVEFGGATVVVGGPGYGDFSDGTRTGRRWVMAGSLTVAALAILGYVLVYRSRMRGEAGGGAD